MFDRKSLTIIDSDTRCSSASSNRATAYFSCGYDIARLFLMACTASYTPYDSSTRPFAILRADGSLDSFSRPTKSLCLFASSRRSRSSMLFLCSPTLETDLGPFQFCINCAAALLEIFDSIALLLLANSSLSLSSSVTSASPEPTDCRLSSSDVSACAELLGSFRNDRQISLTSSEVVLSARD